MREEFTLSSAPSGAAAGDEPLKSRFISALVENERVTSAFLVKDKEVRLKKDGEPYLSLVLSDRTGDIEAKMWDNVAEVLDAFAREDFIKIRGVVSLYREKPQLTIQKLRRLRESDIDLADYLPATTEDVEAMFAEVRGCAAGMADPHLRRLLLSILDDPEIAPRFKRAPAAKSLHHAFFGGLLEHVRSLCRAARLIAPNYPAVRLDLVLAGVILHDLGKLEELSYQRSFAYTTEGQLLGHMVLVLELLHRKIAALPDFPRRLRVLLEHLIISHHGHYEFGSPKLPMFPEAVLLHFLDDLDSKMQAIGEQMRREPERDWTSRNASLERPLLAVERWLNAPAEPPAEPPPSAAPASTASAAGLADQAARLRSALRGGRP